MNVESIYLDTFEAVYAVTGETNGPYGDSKWITRVFRRHKDAVDHSAMLTDRLNSLGISSDIYEYSPVSMPENFIDLQATIYYENSGIFYSVAIYCLS
jgi:hypothetical protein